MGVSITTIVSSYYCAILCSFPFMDFLFILRFLGPVAFFITCLFYVSAFASLG